MITFGLFDQPYLARTATGFPWDPFKDYADDAGVNGLDRGRWKRPNPWVYRRRETGLVCWEPAMHYDDSADDTTWNKNYDDLTGKDLGFDWSGNPWAYHKGFPALFARDPNESYSDDDPVNGLNYTDMGFTGAYAYRDKESGLIVDSTSPATALSNSIYSRSIPMGTDWNRIRISITFAMNSGGANVTGTPRIYIGVGTASNNWIGLCTSSATMTWSGGSITVNKNYSSATSFMRLVGTTYTIVGSTATRYFIADAALGKRRFMFLELWKGSPNNTYTKVDCNTPQFANDAFFINDNLDYYAEASPWAGGPSSLISTMLATQNTYSEANFALSTANNVYIGCSSANLTFNLYEYRLTHIS